MNLFKIIKWFDLLLRNAFWNALEFEKILSRLDAICGKTNIILNTINQIKPKSKRMIAYGYAYCLARYNLTDSKDICKELKREFLDA